MSAEDQEKKARAPLEFIDARHKYALLRHKGETVARALEGFARILRDRPETIAFDGDDAALRNYKGLGDLVNDIQKTGEDLQRLTDLMEQLGFPDTLSENR
ncbi:MAG: hypothetical protein WA734_08680 [Candidatus Acidiferrales bacterium]